MILASLGLRLFSLIFLLIFLLHFFLDLLFLLGPLLLLLTTLLLLLLTFFHLFLLELLKELPQFGIFSLDLFKFFLTLLRLI